MSINIGDRVRTILDKKAGIKRVGTVVEYMANGNLLVNWGDMYEHDYPASALTLAYPMHYLPLNAKDIAHTVFGENNPMTTTIYSLVTCTDCKRAQFNKDMGNVDATPDELNDIETDQLIAGTLPTYTYAIVPHGGSEPYATVQAPTIRRAGEIAAGMGYPLEDYTVGLAADYE